MNNSHTNFCLDHHVLNKEAIKGCCTPIDRSCRSVADRDKLAVVTIRREDDRYDAGLWLRRLWRSHAYNLCEFACLPKLLHNRHWVNAFNYR